MISQDDKNYIDKNVKEDPDPDWIKKGDKMENYPKFQYSVFLKNNGQIVIRADSYAELEAQIKEAGEFIKKRLIVPKNGSNEAVSAEVTNENNPPTCGLHNTPMKWQPPGVSRNGKNYPGFWACGMKDPYGNFCKVKPK